jgi:hypothetical protein
VPLGTRPSRSADDTKPSASGQIIFLTKTPAARQDSYIDA